MNDLRRLIEQETEKFHITLSNGLSFWAPYLRNDNHAEVGSQVPRGLGKASSEEIRESAECIIGLFPDIESETLRQKLVDGSLADHSKNYKGVDCSGFVFFVMSQVYKELFSYSLESELAVSKKNVLNGAFNFLEWKQAYTLTSEEATALPDEVSMQWVVDTFHRRAVNLCNVASLVSDYASHNISVEECRPTDLLHIIIKDDTIPHVAIVTDIASDHITLVHSGRGNARDIGGVTIETIPRTNSSIDTSKLQVPRELIGIRRLKSLAEHIQ